jgi:hypothetical protein
MTAYLPILSVFKCLITYQSTVHTYIKKKVLNFWHSKALRSFLPVPIIPNTRVESCINTSHMSRCTANWKFYVTYRKYINLALLLFAAPVQSINNLNLQLINSSAQMISPRFYNYPARQEIPLPYIAPKDHDIHFKTISLNIYVRPSVFPSA